MEAVHFTHNTLRPNRANGDKESQSFFFFFFLEILPGANNIVLARFSVPMIVSLRGLVCRVFVY